MLQNMDGQTIIWIAIGTMIIVGLLMASNKMRRGVGFIARAVLGVAAVVAINLALGGVGLAIGINALTIAVVAFLGIPGIVMLYGLGFFM